MMISVNVISEGSRQVLAACDLDLLGKNFSKGDLNLEISEDFYGGESMEAEKFVEKLKKAENINLVGEDTIEEAVKLNLVSEDSIVNIQGIPHVQIFKL